MNQILKRFWFRSVSAIVCFVFSWTGIAQSAPALPDFRVLLPSTSINDIVIPAELGTVETFLSASNRQTPSIVHIQTIHGDYETQKTIQKILSYLNQQYGFSLTLVEGASGKLTPELLKFFPDNKINIAVADRLARKGALTGAELFLMDGAHSHSFEAYGVEEVKSYRENLSAFRKVMTKRALSEKFLGFVNHETGRMIDKIESEELRSLIHTWQSFEKDREGLYIFTQKLIKMAKKHLDLDLTSARAQFEWPQLLRLSLLIDT